MNVILVATDGSDGGTAALKEAAAKASADGARLLVLTVAARDLGLGTMSKEVEEYAREEHLAGGEAEGRRAVAEDILAEAKEIVGDRRQLNAGYISRAGDAAEEILACVREHAANVLFLGSRGHGPLGAIFLGSVSRKVAGAAGCSVVVVPKDR
jgi:nucleotide-binding universal stress UspA family protein